MYECVCVCVRCVPERYLSLAAFHNDQFLLWGGSGEDDLGVVPQNIVHLILTEVFQVCAVDHTRLGIPTVTGKAKYGFMKAFLTRR